MYRQNVRIAVLDLVEDPTFHIHLARACCVCWQIKHTFPESLS